jgi:quinone-modifying oxidoreductase subunit QmoC
MARASAMTTAPRPGVLSERESTLRAAFLAEVEKIPGGDRLRRCIQCGTCSGSCPVSHAMDIQPRQIVAYFRAGDIESILRSRTIWICASCYSCTVRCPAEIKVTDLIYGLKRMAIDRNIRMRGLRIYTLSEQFVRLLQRHGRNPELKLVMRYLLREAPTRLVAMAPLGWRMLRAGRLPWRTRRIRGLDGLRKIIAKAEEMEQLYPKERSAPMGRIGYGVVAERAATGGGAP